MAIFPAVSNGFTPDPDQIVDQALRHTIQTPPETGKDGVTNGGALFGEYTTRGSILPPRGTRQRERALHNMYFWDEMNLIRGAFKNIAKIIASVGWEITGDTEETEAVSQLASLQGWRLRKNNGVEYFQEVFRQSNFGGGWTTLITQTILDFLRYDAGAYIEIIGQGNTYEPLRGPVMGLSHLDSLRVYPTGDPRYPAVYYDRYGGIHVMHHSRVIRLVDMDDGSEMFPGYGDSALASAASLAMQELWMTRYITTRLDDQPSPGMSIVGGITRQEWKAGDAQYRQEQSTDTASVWGKRKFYFTPDPSVMPKVENVDFQASPEKFDYRTYTDILVDRLANTLGVDRQEIMQLGSGNLGSGAQSLVLHQKSKGKTIGLLFQLLERKLNDLLPDEFTFEFKNRDTQETLEDAQIAQTLAAAVASMGTALSPEEQRTFLSSNIEMVKDAIDSTPRANDVMNQPMIAADDTPGAAPITTQVNTPSVRVNDDVSSVINAKAAEQKDYQTTQALFISDVYDLLKSAVSGVNPYLDRRAFTVTMRSLLKNYGLQAYKDGMRQGGVTVDALDPEDNTAYMRVFVDQSQYISGLADAVYKDKAVSAANAYDRAFMWGKSLQAFDDEGLASAASNAMFEWRVNVLKEHCPTCLRMNGQVHRFKTYKSRGILPKRSTLACGGWRCGCELVRTTEKARGRF